MKFLYISGTNASPCRFEADFDFLKIELEKIGHEIEWWSVYKNPLPLLNPEEYPSRKAAELEDKIIESDAIIVASPVYHLSISGALKNTLDHTDYKIFKGKKVGLVSNSSSSYSASTIFTHMRTIITEMRGICVPTYVGTVQADYEKINNKSFVLKNDAVKERLMKMVRELELIDVSQILDA